MSDREITALVEQIHASSTRLVLGITGGGSRAIGELLQVPGASRSILEAVVPYDGCALEDWLGHKPEHFCSSQTARRMAMVAFLRGRSLAQRGSTPLAPVAGIGCSASLVSDRPKQGAHRAHVALQTTSQTLVASLELQKGTRTRRQEEQLVAALVLNTCARACQLAARVRMDQNSDDRLSEESCQAPSDWQDLLASRVRKVAQHGAHEMPVGNRRVIFPGAFHPRHAGHLRMARIASARFQAPVEYEISIENVDKPPLDFLDMQSRSAQFDAQESLWFTRAPTFVEKSALFPGCTFVVGADTIVRLADARYYAHDARARREAIERIAERGCRLLVFGRQLAGQFQCLADLNLPDWLLAICDEVRASEFRQDISSTELRGLSQA